jgi:hypothetical protein
VSVVFGYLHGILFISLHCMGCWEESLLFRGWSPGEGPMGDRPVHTPDPLRSRSSLFRISFTEIRMHSVMSLYCFTGHLVLLCAQTSRHCRPGRALVCSWMKKSEGDFVLLASVHSVFMLWCHSWMPAFAVQLINTLHISAQQVNMFSLKNRL